MTSPPVTIVGGGRPDVVDLEDLRRAARLLAHVAAHLHAADRALVLAAGAAQPGLATQEGRVAARAVAGARHGRTAPARLAAEARDLTDRLERAILAYGDAESGAHRALRGVVVLDGALRSLAPGATLARVLLGGSVVVGAGAAAAGATWHGMVLAAPFGRADDVLRAQRDLLARRVPALVARGLADGRTELAVVALATGILGPGGLVVPARDRVRLLARGLVRFLPEPGPTVVVSRPGAPQLPVPRDTAGAIAAVALTYDDGSATGLRGTPEATITVQRLTHPDGTVAWLVAVPGTQRAGFAEDAPTDNGTNPRLVGGLPDDMSTAVLEAMHLAGIAADEPVMLVGHSQGGMVAMSVASLAAGTYAVAAVATAGSPDPTVRPLPPSVQVVHLRDPADPLHQVDGSPDRVATNVRVVRGSVERLDGLPVRTPAEAHGVGRYVRLAEHLDAVGDDPQVRAYSAAVASVLGPEGTTATTRQFVATRDPAVVALDPATGLPRPDRLSPVGGPVPPRTGRP
ncbi:hypothetical protein [Cellulomonas fimi]|uniref:Uncharacterized protein n=1 Tax=Cellulomonas fimi (strain ATCC 484 / DSM 20113 / JCM 1341 / CCUG 24087 / LMG 16345 / NBRC 15513 / NCIMB 8980 / NCTC 7547 / NRS-133) TaxID=590998 RepID=F4H681_CELFA|nr:hypothetical protein [Cellulomonas fimi]AEE44393.1 hypothetical protein Celf_0248 [Cellulomonas fimi ATCC 484]NNH08898.1 hypothetical protein [Cellulomonas fimi]VEH26271.1 Uncharacterised protein [Cellulomonas fimi]